MSDSHAIPGRPVSQRPATMWIFGYINVVVASMAMTATLPGRTHGLGLITEPLLRDLSIAPTEFARINFLGAIVGAFFCLPAGWLIDRIGVRLVLTFTTLLLGLSVVAMSVVQSPTGLIVWLTLVRGFGQSALSLAAMSLISKWFRSGVASAMAAFAVLLTFGFIISVLAMGSLIESLHWRGAWRGLGWVLVGASCLFGLLARDLRERDSGRGEPETDSPERQWSLKEALRSPVFWVVVFGCGLFNFVWSAVTLFNESMMAEQNLPTSLAVEVMAVLTGTGLIANLACGKLATRERVLPILFLGLVALSAGLSTLAFVPGALAARIYGGLTGISGGIVTVVFFAFWRQFFGQQHLGRIQGMAQMVMVFASATGPVVAAEMNLQTGSCKSFLVSMAILSLFCGSATMFLPPRK